MSELHAGLREMLAMLAAGDPACKRFGAAQHRYELLPPVDLAAFSALAGTLPPECSDYVDHVTQLSSGGAGPYYGLFPALRAAQFVRDRALPLAHLGCGYLAVLRLDGPTTGQIWLDARELDLTALIAPSFSAFYLDWIDRLAHNRWLEGHVPIGRCALQAALSGYLNVCEVGLGLAQGELAGAALRDALAGLGPCSIKIAAEGPLFEPGEVVDPCITCARMIENLAADGLAPTVVAPGVQPLPAR